MCFYLNGNIVIQRYMLYIFGLIHVICCGILPSYTEEGYRLLADLFTNAYDHDWDTAHILKKNRESVTKVGKLTNPLPHHERNHKWKEQIRCALK